MGVFSDWAKKYWEKGFVPIPVSPQTKGAAVKGWANFATDGISEAALNDLIQKHGQCNIGLATGHKIFGDFSFVAVDVDSEDMVQPVIAALYGRGRPAKIGKKGLTVFCLAPVGMDGKTIRIKRKGQKPDVEVLKQKAQTVIPPSVHPETGQPYEWLGKDLLECEQSDFTVLIPEMLDEISAWCEGKSDHFKALNEMVWLGEGKGGNTHDTCVPAVGCLVARGWSDTAIFERIKYAKKSACERNGDEYNWPEEHKQITEWITSARSKQFDQNEGKKPKQRPPERELADWVIEYFGGDENLVTYQGLLRRYTEGHWPTVDNGELKRTLLRTFPDVANMHVSTAIETVQDICYRADFSALGTPLSRRSAKRICLVNGALNMDTGVLERFSPDHELTNKLDFEWDPDATCPAFDKFLEQTFGEEHKARDCVLEYMAHTLVPDMSFQKMMFFTGKGSTGKSTMTRLLNAFHDSTSVGSIDISKISDERNLTSLAGKLVNFTGEMSRVSTLADDVIKRITGQDPVTIRRLFLEPINNVYLTVRFLVTTNEMPKINDASSAFRRRLIVIRFNNVVAAEDRDPGLEDILKAERPGILARYLLPAFQRLYARGRFDPPETSEDEIDQFFIENDPVAYWLAENIEVLDPNSEDKKNWTTTAELFENFMSMCEVINVKWQPTIMTWSRKLTEMGMAPSVKKKLHGNVIPIRPMRIKNKNGVQF